MNLCVVSSKECWQTESGRWFSSGGFPVQMAAIGSLFDVFTLLVTKVNPKPGGIPLPNDARIISLPKPSGKDAQRKFSILIHLPRYIKIMLSYIREADVVHVPVPGDLSFLGMATAIVLRKRLIVRYGGSWEATAQTTWMNRITKVCLRWFAGERNVMLVTGEGEAPPGPGMHWIFSTALSKEELHQIHPQLDRGLSDSPRLVYIGRLSPEKGVKYLVSAVAHLKRDGFRPIPIVTLVGDGPERKQLEEVVSELGCADRISFKGQLNRECLFKLLKQADLCVQPSLTEGFSKAWLDAMAHGLPIITSNVGAAKRVIGERGERGWLLPPGEVEELASTIKDILSTPLDWPALRRRCRIYVEGCTLEAWVEQIGQICARQWGIALNGGKLRE